MLNQRLLTYIKKVLFIGLLLFPLTLHASFIESTIGAAVVNDATATFYNPAGLTLLKNPQIITQGSASNFRTRFTGQTTQSLTGFTQSGNSTTQAYYYLPSLYLAVPTPHKITFGLAMVGNFLNGNIEEGSISRYDQSSNNIKNFDFVPAVGVKVNDFFAVGAGVNLSYADFLMQPIVGFPTLNIPDIQSRNESNGTGLGWDLGFLLKESATTLIGFNYRSAITYDLSGSSVFQSNPPVTSNNYHFTFWTPARSVLSFSHLVSPVLGFIATVQRVNWSILKNINIQGIAARVGSQPVILNASAPFNLHDTWIVTLGSNYRVTPKWIIRIAATYNQASANGNYQISPGDSIVAGASTGYEIYKNIIIDGSYAHAFIKNQNINITGGRNLVNGINRAWLDSMSLKLTFNV